KIGVEVLLQKVERLTVRRYYLGMVAQGVWWAGYILFPFVLGKSLAAPGWVVTLSVTMETTAMLAALYWGHLLARGGRRKWLFRGGLLGRVGLVAMFAVSTPLQFTALLAPVYFFQALIYPAQNGILQANIRPERRGAVFGWGALISNLTAAATGLVVGGVLDAAPERFDAVYATIGAIGFLYSLTLSSLPRPEGDTTPDAADAFFGLPRLPLGPVRWRRLAGALVRPFREAATTFRTDHAFFWYEMNFMIYGTSFLMLGPVVPLYFVKRLDLSYEVISASRVMIATIGVALLSPLFGRLMDRINPVRLSTFSYATIAAYPAMLALIAVAFADRPAVGAYLAFAVYSVGNAGLNVTWNMGSIFFAPAGEGGHYQGVHVALVGIRGLIGPALGFVLYRLLGYQGVFVASVAIFLGAAFSSWLLGRAMEGGRIRSAAPAAGAS
ncbi:MAG TPA: MFS transporter, partial [Candidatus Krumholzibacteria bacterium]|nr:MFS transporter [Candidatus Krumholzibacteria bacterium]